MEKKLYEAPKMTVVDMEVDFNLLADSGNVLDDTPEYDGDFGFNVAPGRENRQA